MVGDRKDLSEMEIEDAPFNYPIKKVVPMRKLLPTSPMGGSIDYTHKLDNPLNLSTEGLSDNYIRSVDDTLIDGVFSYSPERRAGAHTPNSPGTPTFLLRHNPAGSAFRLVESPGNTRHASKISGIRDGNVLTPGLVFVPDNSERSKYNESYAGERSSADLSNSNLSGASDPYGFSGAFEHHIRFPTPLNKIHRYDNENHNLESNMNYGWVKEEDRDEDMMAQQNHALGLDFSPNSGSNYNYKSLTESPSSDAFFEVKPKGLFGSMENNFAPSNESISPNIMGIVSQLVNSQMAPDSFIKSYLTTSCEDGLPNLDQNQGEDRGREEKVTSVVKSLRYDNDPREAKSFDSLYAEDSSSSGKIEDRLNLNPKGGVGSGVSNSTDYSDKTWGEQIPSVRSTGEFNSGSLSSAVGGGGLGGVYSSGSRRGSGSVGQPNTASIGSQNASQYPMSSQYAQESEQRSQIHQMYQQQDAAYPHSFQIPPLQQVNQQQLLQLLLAQQQNRQQQHSTAGSTLDPSGFPSVTTPMMPWRNEQSGPGSHPPLAQGQSQSQAQLQQGQGNSSGQLQKGINVAGSYDQHTHGQSSGSQQLPQMPPMSQIYREGDSYLPQYSVEPSLFLPSQQVMGSEKSHVPNQHQNMPKSGQNSVRNSGTWGPQTSHSLMASSVPLSAHSADYEYQMPQQHSPQHSPQHSQQQQQQQQQQNLLSQSWSPHPNGIMGGLSNQQQQQQGPHPSLSQEFYPSNSNSGFPGVPQQGLFTPFVFVPQPTATSPQYHSQPLGQVLMPPGAPQYGQYRPQTHQQMHNQQQQQQQQSYGPGYPPLQYVPDSAEQLQYQGDVSDLEKMYENELAGRMGTLNMNPDSRFQFLDRNSRPNSLRMLGQVSPGVGGQGQGQEGTQSRPLSLRQLYSRSDSGSGSMLITQNVLSVSASAAPFLPQSQTVPGSDYMGSGVGSLQDSNHGQRNIYHDNHPQQQQQQQHQHHLQQQHQHQQHQQKQQQQQQQQHRQYNQNLHQSQMIDRVERDKLDRDNRSNRDSGSYLRGQMLGGDYDEKPFLEAKQRESWENQGSSLYDLHRPPVGNMGGGGGGGGVHGSGMGHAREDARHRPLSLPLSLSHGLGLGLGEDSMRHSLESKQSQSSDRPHSYSVYGHQRGGSGGGPGGGHHSDNNSNSSSTSASHSNMNSINNSHNNAITTSTTPHPSHVAPKDRSELVESPHSKLAYKDFYRHFRGMERESVEVARKYAEESLLWMPETARWRVLLELADLAKRGNDFEKARELYGSVCELQPLASQGWLEWAKMEEECGQVKYSLKILREGLSQCKLNEGLLTKAIKQQEKLHDVDAARGMLSALRHESIERVWKAVLEGALLEARAGRISVARKFLQYLIQHVPWYGPIYFEAFKLEDRDERDAAALLVVKKGLKELPRYGPLWFGLLRIIERRDCKSENRQWLVGIPPVLARTREEANLAVRRISRELVWKIHFEKAQAEERAADCAALGMYHLAPKCSALKGLPAARDGLLGTARASLVKSLLACPPNLQWKVWLAGARLELSAGSLGKARSLLCQAFKTVPTKSRSHVFLECSRVEEYANNLDGARRLLQKARSEVKGEWKVFLESVLLEARSGNYRGAVRQADEALVLHTGTGRLWAILVLICHRLEGLIPPRKERRERKDSKLATESVRDRERDGDGDRMDDIIAHCEVGDVPETEGGADAGDKEVAGGKEVAEAVTDAVPEVEVEVVAEAQLEPEEDEDYPVPSKLQALLRAIQEVPKSGEVWCEGARCHMNPLHLASFNLSSALKFLSFAVQFTPQYGDTFLEFLRLEMILQVVLPRVLNVLGVPIISFFRRFLGHDVDSDSVCVLNDFGWLQSVSLPDDESHMCTMGAPGTAGERGKRQRDILGLDTMELDIGQCVEAYGNVQLKNLTRRCTNSDPNYGTTWFHYRCKPYDTPNTVLKSALRQMTFELASAQPVYVRAVSRYVQKCLQKGHKGEKALSRAATLSAETGHDDEKSARVELIPSACEAGEGNGEVGEVTVPVPVPSEVEIVTEAVILPSSPPLSSSPTLDAVTATVPVTVSPSVPTPVPAPVEAPAPSSAPASASAPLSASMSEAASVSASLCGDAGDADLSALVASQEAGPDHALREKELLQDFELALKNRKSTVGAPLAAGGVGGPIYCSPDFVTASIEMNRALFNRHLTGEEKRKVLFGSDQIVP